MCKTGSGFLTETDAYMPVNTNSHSKMIAASGVRESGPGQRINIVKYEYVAPGGNFFAHPNEWRFTLDQDLLPEWWSDDPAANEARAFTALECWWREKFVQGDGGLWHCEGPLYIEGPVHQELNKLTTSGFIDARSAQSLDGAFPALTTSGDIYAGSAQRKQLLAQIAKRQAH